MRDYVAISYGVGVQSTTMLLMAEAGLITPRPDVAIFADTGWEPQSVYDRLEWVKTQTSIPIERVTNKGRSLYRDTWDGVNVTGNIFTTIPSFAAVPDKHSFSISMTRRTCTRDYKITPIRRALRRGLEASGLKSVSLWIGISTDEAIRMKPSPAKYINHRWPLIEAGFTRMDCLQWFNQHYPGRTLSRSSCVGCPFHSDAEWLRLAEEAPEDMAKTVALDARLRSPDRPRPPRGPAYPQYLHVKAKPLGEVLERLKRNAAMGQQLSMLDQFGNECEGLCGV